MSSLDDSVATRRLLRMIELGNTDAIAKLLARHRQKLRKAIELRLSARIRARMDVSDILQEAELAAFTRMADFLKRRPMPFALWLRKTAQELLVKAQLAHRRAGRRSVDREEWLPEGTKTSLVDQLCADVPTPSENLRKKERAEKIKGILDELSDADREILVMRYLERMTNQEIAIVTNLAPMVISKRHGRAILRLRRYLDENDIHESDV